MVSYCLMTVTITTRSSRRLRRIEEKVDTQHAQIQRLEGKVDGLKQQLDALVDLVSPAGIQARLNAEAASLDQSSAELQDAVNHTKGQ